MNGSELDHMIEFAISELAAGDPERIRGVVRHIAQRWPEQKALMICFALTSAAAQFEDVFTDGRTARGPQVAYKMAALVAGDVLAAEAMGISPVKGRDLMHYWRRSDPYFLS